MADAQERSDEHFHLPEPTIWPATLAAGIVFFALGLVTNFLIAIAGIAICIVGFAGWVRDLLQEGHSTHGQHDGVGGDVTEDTPL